MSTALHLCYSYFYDKPEKYIIDLGTILAKDSIPMHFDLEQTSNAKKSLRGWFSGFRYHKNMKTFSNQAEISQHWSFLRYWIISYQFWKYSFIVVFLVDWHNAFVSNLYLTGDISYDYTYYRHWLNLFYRLLLVEHLWH